MAGAATHARPGTATVTVGVNGDADLSVSDRYSASATVVSRDATVTVIERGSASPTVSDVGSADLVEV